MATRILVTVKSVRKQRGGSLAVALASPGERKPVMTLIVGTPLSQRDRDDWVVGEKHWIDITPAYV